MKIVIEQYDHKITYELEHNDVLMEEILYIFERVLKATGYDFQGKLEIVDNEQIEQ